MKTHILQTSLFGESTKLTAPELQEVIGFAKHLREVRKLTASKRIAMEEIKQALKSGYSF